MYWLVEDEHERDVLKNLLRIFGNENAEMIDPSRDDLTLGLSRLLKKEPGVYLMTVDTYQELSKMLESARQPWPEPPASPVPHPSPSVRSASSAFYSGGTSPNELAGVQHIRTPTRPRPF